MWPRVQVLEFYFEQGGRINSHQSSKTIPWERADDDCHISTSFKDLATPVGAGPRPSAGTSAHGLANWMVAYIIIHRNTKSDQGVQIHQLIILIGKMMSHAHTYIHIYIYIGLPPKCQTTGMWTLQAVPPRFPASHGTIWVVATTHTTYIYIYIYTYVYSTYMYIYIYHIYILSIRLICMYDLIIPYYTTPKASSQPLTVSHLWHRFLDSNLPGLGSTLAPEFHWMGPYLQGFCPNWWGILQPWLYPWIKTSRI